MHVVFQILPAVVFPPAAVCAPQVSVGLGTVTSGKFSIIPKAAKDKGKQPDADLLALHDVLNRLAEIDPDQGRIVELRFFGGLTIEETAEVMHVSHATVEREWRVAKAWLKRELTKA
jgi:DNA-directed RNA polymerase specialized sigma24 family protein